MTKKVFEAVAAVLRDEREKNSVFKEDRRHIVNGLLLSLAVELSDRFAAENARFDRDRFLKACGV